MDMLETTQIYGLTDLLHKVIRPILDNVELLPNDEF